MRDRAYDVFGAPRAVTGTTQNDFRYTGQQDDRNANRGLYYLRARAYDPALGRFLQQDPLPLINRYSYVGGNPVNFADPTGMCHIIPCIERPGPPIPWPFPPVDVPDLPTPDFDPNVVENWKRHIDWIKKKFTGPEKRFFDPKYSPPRPDTLWPNPPMGPEDIPPLLCNLLPPGSRARCWALLAALAATGVGGTIEELHRDLPPKGKPQ
jgi:RHS repeat-associated protein